MANMLTITTLFLTFSFISKVITSPVGSRSPHGLAYQNPIISISPSAYDFFHPNASQITFPLVNSAANLRATQVHQPTLPASPAKASSSVGPGGVAGILLGLASTLLLAMGAYYVVLTRRSNSARAPDCAV